MKDLSERSLHAPPWWLISCAALEPQSDIPAHQTPLSLTGTPVIAQRFIIVSHSVLACAFLPPYLHVREFTAELTVAFQNTVTIRSQSCPSRLKMLTGEELLFSHRLILNVQSKYPSRSKLYSGAQCTGKHGVIIGASWCMLNSMSVRLNKARLLNFWSRFSFLKGHILIVSAPTAANGPRPAICPASPFEKNWHNHGYNH